MFWCFVGCFLWGVLFGFGCVVLGFFCPASFLVVSKNREYSSEYSHLTHFLFNSSFFRFETFCDFFRRNSLPCWNNKNCLYVHMFLTPFCYTVKNKKEAMPPTHYLQLEILLLEICLCFPFVIMFCPN